MQFYLVDREALSSIKDLGLAEMLGALSRIDLPVAELVKSFVRSVEPLKASTSLPTACF